MNYLKIYKVYDYIPSSIAFHTLELSDGSTLFTSAMASLFYKPSMVKISSSGRVQAGLYASDSLGVRFSKPCEIMGSNGTIIFSCLDSFPTDRFLFTKDSESIVLKNKEAPYGFVRWFNNGTRAIGFPGGIANSILSLTGDDPSASGLPVEVNEFGLTWVHMDDLEGSVAACGKYFPGDYDLFIFRPNGSYLRFPLRYTHPYFNEIISIRFVKNTQWLAIHWANGGESQYNGLTILNTNNGFKVDIPLEYSEPRLNAVYFDGSMVHIGLNGWGVYGGRLSFSVSDPSSYSIMYTGSGGLWVMGSSALFPSNPNQQIIAQTSSLSVIGGYLSDINSGPNYEISERFTPSVYIRSDEVYKNSSITATWRGSRFFILASAGAGIAVYSNRPDGGPQVGYIGG